MKYTKEYLLEAADKFIQKKISRDPSVSAVFLIGSLRKVDHFVDRPMDVDLLILKDAPFDIENELVRINDSYHLDVHYDDVSLYEDPKPLRGDGIRGWALWDAEVLYQREHIFEFTQSAVRAQFDEPKFVVERMRFFCQRARDFWLAHNEDPTNVAPDSYLDAVANAANALASIDHEPLSIRSLLGDLINVTASLEVSDINTDFFNCLSDDLSTNILQENLPLWNDLFTEGTKYPADSIIIPLRSNYFRHAITSALESDRPIAAFWPFLFTLSKMPIRFSENELLKEQYAALMKTFGFDSEGMKKKMKALDLLLEDIEGIIEQILEDYSVD